MARRLQTLLVAAALLQFAGGHWFTLQLIAWGRMVVDYSRANGVAEAIVMTFDGKHPCQLCVSIATARELERREGVPSLPGTEDQRPLLLGLPPMAVPRIASSHLLSRTPSPNTLFDLLRDPPPVPPPRLPGAV